MAMLLGVVIVFGEQIETLYYKFIWEPPTKIENVGLEETRSDIYFKWGEPSFCKEENRICTWAKEYSGRTRWAYFVGDQIDSLLVHDFSDYPYLREIPFQSVEEMHEIMGPENIQSRSSDMKSRMYVYVEHEISFLYSENRLNEYRIGLSQWNHFLENTSEYIVDGKVICPAIECPFDENGETLEIFKDKDYTFFMDQ